MTDFKKDLKRRLADISVPEPRPDARGKARDAAMTEFRRLRREKRVKGIVRTIRPTGKTPEGRPVMRKLAYATAGLAFCGIAAAIVIPNFLNFRLKATSPAPRSNLDAMRGTEVTSSTAPLADFEVAAPSAPPPRMAMKAKSPASKQRMRYSNEPGPPPLSQEYVGRDRFEKITPNPVKVTAAEPVSTFSIDVDTASYAFVRRALKSGHLPQKNAVRIEEMVNYFDYDYPLPSDRSAPFRPTVTVFPTPWNRGTKLLHIGIKGLDIMQSERPRANLVFLLDVSGSMNAPDKLPLLKNSFRMLVETLDPEDTVAIVVYAGAAGTILEPTKARERGRILATLERLHAGGSTAGGAGIRRAYALAEESFDPDGVNRVILATDGDFNVGIRNPEELKNFVERKRKSGVYLSVLGFGQGNLNDELMQKLAQHGNGNAAYIDTLSEARKVLVDEAVGTLFTIANDVKIQVEFNPAIVAEYRLIGYETRLLKREDFRNDKVDAGDVGSGHTVTALYEITPVGSAARMIDDLRYGRKMADGEVEQREISEYAFLKIRYKLPDESTSRLITTPVGRALEFGSIADVPGEARFAAAVAAFGQLLRDDPYTKEFAWDDVIDLARPARGEDPFGYRSEFLSLVRLAETARAMGDR